MTKEQYKDALTVDLVREIFEVYTISSQTPKWVIEIGGKIIAVNGIMFYPTREQAVKAFYNSFSWRARRALYQRVTNSDGWGYWRSNDRTLMWKAIKEKLTEDYSFKIVQI